MIAKQPGNGRARRAVAPLVMLAAGTLAAGCGAAPAATTEQGPTASGAPSVTAVAPTATAARAAAPRHSVRAPASWTESREGSVVRFTSPERDTVVRLVVVEESDLSAAVATAWKKASPEMKLRERQRATGAGSERFASELVVTYTDDAVDQVAQAIALGRAPHAYVFLVEGPIKSVDKRGAEIAQILQSLEIEGAPRTELAPGAAKPLDDARRAELFAFVERGRAIVDGPGVVVAVVTKDRADTAAFGVRTLGASEPVDADTPFMIGSVTKSFSTLLLATLVDEGKLAWDTPVRQAYPSFRLADAERSEAMRIQHLFCACVGAARRDMELLFEFARVRPADVFGQIARMQLTTGFGETFQYNNQLTAAGGLIAGHVAYPEMADLGQAYRRAMEKRVLEPLGMKSTSLDLDAVARARKHASPHQLDWSGKTDRVDLGLERFVTPYAPAGALWSTANDMAKYLRLQLTRGLLPDGKRLVSESNLGRTQTGQVKAGERMSYGMGWLVGKTKGLASVEHSGGTMGFSSNVIFFPELGVGLFTAMNRSSSGGLHSAVAERLLELLYDLPPRVESELRHDAGERTRLLAEQRAKVSADPVPAELLGRYRDEALGEITLRREGERTVIDAGEWTSTLAVLDPKEAADTLLVTSAPLQGLTLRREARDGQPVLVLKFGQTEYLFRRR